MSEPLVLVEKDPSGYVVVTLNRPNAMNALSSALRAELARIIDGLEADPEVRVLILTGAGRAFCAGLDLKELGASDRSPLSGSLGAQANPVRAIGQFSGPVIGAINGVAITGGFELALACDVLLASTEACFADTHARVGILPGWGLSQKLSRIIGIGRAKELSLTGNFLGAAQACDWGLVNRVVPPAQLLPDARQLAGDMLSMLPDALVAYRKLIDDGFGMNFTDAMELESSVGRAWSAQVRAEDVEARREAIRQRGQAQKG